jgi:recombination protein RecA
MMAKALDILNKKKSKKSENKKETKKKSKIKITTLTKKDKKEAEKVTEEVLQMINKKFGQNAMIRAKDLDITDYGRISSGCFAIDIAIGGGFKIGRINSISGVYSIGKSLIAYHTIAYAQRELGLVCTLIDAEGVFDPYWAEKCGVDTEALLLSQPGGAEEALQIAIDCQKMGIDFAVVDSIEALEPTKEMDKEMDESQQMAIKPKIIGEYLRKFNAFNN